MKRALVSLAIVAALSGTAFAEKSLRTARLLSGVGTGASSVVFVSAFFVGEKNGDVNMPLLYAGLGSGVITPSLGEMYVGRYVTFGMGLRVAAGLLATYGVLGHDQEVRCNNTVEFQTCRSLSQTSYILVGLAGIMFVGGAAWDIQALPDHVEEHNRENAGFALTPTLLPTSGGDPAFGLAAIGTF
ncbi:MAG: hypothetical protein ACKV2T_03170 [Kofleriaceae bacterium]